MDWVVLGLMIRIRSGAIAKCWFLAAFYSVGMAHTVNCLKMSCSYAQKYDHVDRGSLRLKTPYPL